MQSIKHACWTPLQSMRTPRRIQDSGVIGRGDRNKVMLPWLLHVNQRDQMGGHGELFRTTMLTVQDPTRGEKHEARKITKYRM